MGRQKIPPASLCTGGIEPKICYLLSLAGYVESSRRREDLRREAELADRFALNAPEAGHAQRRG